MCDVRYGTLPSLGVMKILLRVNMKNLKKERRSRL